MLYATHCGILQPLCSFNIKCYNSEKRATVPRQLIQFCSPRYHNGHMSGSEILSVTCRRMPRRFQKTAVASLRGDKRRLWSPTRKRNNHTCASTRDPFAFPSKQFKICTDAQTSHFTFRSVCISLISNPP